MRTLSLSHMCNRVFSRLCACALHTSYCAGAFSYARESVVAGLGSEMLLCSPRVDYTLVAAEEAIAKYTARAYVDTVSVTSEFL